MRGETHSRCPESRNPSPMLFSTPPRMYFSDTLFAWKNSSEQLHFSMIRELGATLDSSTGEIQRI